MSDRGPQSNTIKSNETLFAIIELLKEKNGAGVTEVAHSLGLAKSSVHKHLKSLEEYNYVVNENGFYRLSLQFFHYGEYTRNQYEIYRAAQSKLDELADQTGEMVWLMTQENGMGIYLDGVQGNTQINVNTVMGSWFQLHYNSGGKAILAHLGRDTVNQIIDQQGLTDRTANTITEPDHLYEELQQIRERGYALNRGEDLKGIHAVGVPLVFDGMVHGALSIAGAAHRFTDERCKEYADLLLAAANDIELSVVYE